MLPKNYTDEPLLYKPNASGNWIWGGGGELLKWIVLWKFALKYNIFPRLTVSSHNYKYSLFKLNITE